MGATLILGSIIFVAVLAIFLLIMCLIRNRQSQKVQKCKMFLKNKVYLNPVLRYSMLNSLKLNFVAMNSLNRMSEVTARQLIPAILILTLISFLVPMLIARLLYRKRDILEQPATMQAFGTVYQGRRTQRPKAREWLSPLLFFGRRTAFVVVSIFSFERPVIQMCTHQVLTMLAAIYLSRDSQMFLTEAQKVTEISTEAFLLMTSALL